MTQVVEMAMEPEKGWGVRTAAEDESVPKISKFQGCISKEGFSVTI